MVKFNSICVLFFQSVRRLPAQETLTQPNLSTSLHVPISMDRTGPGHGQDRIGYGQDRTRRPRLDSTGQHKIGQGRTGQDRTRHYWTGQITTGKHSTAQGYGYKPGHGRDRDRRKELDTDSDVPFMSSFLGRFWVVFAYFI